MTYVCVRGRMKAAQACFAHDVPVALATGTFGRVCLSQIWLAFWYPFKTAPKQVPPSKKRDIVAFGTTHVLIGSHCSEQQLEKQKAKSEG